MLNKQKKKQIHQLLQSFSITIANIHNQNNTINIRQ
jgi:hypothetical protein